MSDTLRDYYNIKSALCQVAEIFSATVIKGGYYDRDRTQKRIKKKA